MSTLEFVLNQVTVRSLPFQAFLDVAADAGCMGVEARDDLGRPLFDGLSPEVAAREAEARGLILLGINQIHPFDVDGDAPLAAARRLAPAARDCGARFLSLIPRIDCAPDDPRVDDVDRLVRALEVLLPELERCDLVGLIEPLGLSRASLTAPEPALRAIERLGRPGRLQIVLDTFQQTLARGWRLPTDHTGLVQISGISDIHAVFDDALDGRRDLVGPLDLVPNLDLIRSLVTEGYDGPFSFECTSPDVHRLDDPAAALRESIRWIRGEVPASR